MTNILNFIELHALSISIIITLLVGAGKFWQYIDIKSNELKQKRYENYHQLVERLIAPPPGTPCPIVEVQKVVVFEFRNYPEYKKVTGEILNRWLKRDDIVGNDGDSFKMLMKDTLKQLRIEF